MYTLSSHVKMLFSEQIRTNQAVLTTWSPSRGGSEKMFRARLDFQQSDKENQVPQCSFDLIRGHCFPNKICEFFIVDPFHFGFRCDNLIITRTFFVVYSSGDIETPVQ